VRDREIKADTLPIGRVSSLVYFFAVAVALGIGTEMAVLFCVVFAWLVLTRRETERQNQASKTSQKEHPLENIAR